MAGEIITPILNRPNFDNVSVGPKSVERLNALFQRAGGPMRKDGNWSVVDHDGRRCMQSFFPKGKTHYDTGFNEWRDLAPGPAGLQEAWIGLRFKWSEGFVYPPGGKFFGLTCGGLNAPEGIHGSGGAGPASNMRAKNLGGSMKLRPVTLANGNMGFALYLYDHLMTGKYGRNPIGTFGNFTTGEWHEVAMRFVMNNPLTANNGIIQVWIDKVLVGSYGGIAWSRPHITAKGFVKAALNNFTGGSGPTFYTHHDSFNWVDSFYLWKTNNPKGNALYGKNEIVSSLMGDLGVVIPAPDPIPDPDPVVDTPINIRVHCQLVVGSLIV
jgi:hypothetical protein